MFVHLLSIASGSLLGPIWYGIISQISSYLLGLSDTLQEFIVEHIHNIRCSCDIEGSLSLIDDSGVSTSREQCSHWVSLVLLWVKQGRGKFRCVMLRIGQSALHFTSLTDLFNQILSQLLWEVQPHATSNARRLRVHISSTVYCL